MQRIITKPVLDDIRQVFKQSTSTILTAKETPEKIQEYIDSGCEFVKVGTTKSPKGNVTEVKE